jgi:hypothetical protein
MTRREAAERLGWRLDELAAAERRGITQGGSAGTHTPTSNGSR